KWVDWLLREAYGQMPVLTSVVPFEELEEYNTSSIDMGSIGNKPLPCEYYDANTFTFTPQYHDFLGKVMEKMDLMDFDYSFPVVIPEK
ncbi:MAG: hypothetical protein K2I68_03560, partial [Bacteroidales bacterium]|nr:hypothetical protein [Bacteroidales bacterium]